MKFDLVDYLISKGLRKFRLKETQAIACCPFHNDGSPSFSVNVKTGAWLCRASSTCGKKGGLVALVAGLEKCSFKEAAKIAQVRAPLYSEKDFEELLRGRTVVKKEPTYPELPANTPVTQHYPEYLTRRRYPVESGIAGPWDLRVGVRGRDPYNGRFADYLILPVYDRLGAYLSFTARYMGTDPARPRYDGPSDSLKDYLYGEWQLSDGDGPIYIVEGQFDVLRLWTFREDALGTLGTTYTNKQVRRICELTGNRPIVVCYDTDTINRQNADFIEVETLHSTPMRLVSQLYSLGKDCRLMDLARSGVKDADGLADVEAWTAVRGDSVVTKY